jgi:hypothetical protein
VVIKRDYLETLADCCLPAPLRHVMGSPHLGLLRALRHHTASRVMNPALGYPLLRGIPPDWSGTATSHPYGLKLQLGNFQPYGLLITGLTVWLPVFRCCPLAQGGAELQSYTTHRVLVIELCSYPLYPGA